ncbi:TetR family transcriptional regulator [Mycobacterium kubicae]|uniref:TetR family transcriptional regulator n=1 Tax=Mycobacterium kubicae TaxID=120959 RepID=A0AAX1J594_9MYCO|nr:TetR family transcriptional regulator [Mycobacterium kubicae]MCV7094784.1 TetR/AcrR family transcriptional regulator [Mycobacterium kubicae]QNI13118.1 TetR/AcrR family transcriptional regulator [Mycobacterium kubicae]QPI36634.1 TetR family transcriptional regulator [Mycobacterium kubicae]GFG67399.1 TetR family transcriptional regulator [Mycobacterium kubicae]
MAFTQRSENTRTAILTAARQMLASRGYEATTIRAVAAAAGIDPSMVMRYYGNKQGLFAAAVDVDLQLPDPSALPADNIGNVLAHHVISRWEGALSDEFITLLLRSAGTNSAAAEQFRLIFERQLLKFVQGIAGRGQLARRRAAMVSSQVLGVAYCRYILELPAVTELDGETLANTLGPVLQHYLTGDLSGPVDATAAKRGKASTAGRSR